MFFLRAPNSHRTKAFLLLPSLTLFQPTNSGALQFAFQSSYSSSAPLSLKLPLDSLSLPFFFILYLLFSSVQIRLYLLSGVSKSSDVCISHPASHLITSDLIPISVSNIPASHPFYLVCVKEMVDVIKALMRQPLRPIIRDAAHKASLACTSRRPDKHCEAEGDKQTQLWAMM